MEQKKIYRVLLKDVQGLIVPVNLSLTWTRRTSRDEARLSSVPYCISNIFFVQIISSADHIAKHQSKQGSTNLTRQFTQS